MSFNKDRVMQELQRFGGAMYTPVILFAFFGLTVALSIIFSNTGLFGSLAEKGTLWYDFWYVVQQGAWTVFNQMPILFAIAVPIGFAKKEQARCAMEGFVIYMVFNYFIAGILTLHGSYFGVDYSQDAGAGTGLAMIANIKTLDMGMLGAIFIACISAYLHNRFYDTEIPDWLGIFKGPAFVVAVGFLVMLPMALLFCYIWPPIQHGIEQFQFFLKTSGIQAYWLQHLNDFATSAHSLRDLFPQGGFALHGSAKVFGLTGAALAMYYCAKPEKRKKVATLLIPATITAVLCGITEPIEFTFLFVAPILYIVHAVLAATLSATLYFIGLSGNFDGGLIDCFVQNWIPLFRYHAWTYILQIAIGLGFTAIYFVVFRFLILHFDLPTPGRTDDGGEDKLFTKAEYKAKKEMEKKGIAGGADALKAQVFLDCLGGPDNIREVTNCATRLRVTVNDPDKVAATSKFTNAGAFGLVKNGHAIQVIVGLSVPNVRGHFDALMKGEMPAVAESTVPETKEALAEKTAAPAAEAVVSVDEDDRSMKLKAFVSGDLVDISEVPDDAFSQKMMGDGVAIKPSSDTVVAPADATVSMIMESSLHAIGLELSNGAEVLIHIGLDTVNMNGQGFTLLTQQDAQVKAGDPLIRFDRDAIAKAGYDDIVIMAVTNSTEYPQMKKEADQPVVAGETPIVIF